MVKLTSFLIAAITVFSLITACSTSNNKNVTFTPGPDPTGHASQITTGPDGTLLNEKAGAGIDVQNKKNK